MTQPPRKRRIGLWVVGCVFALMLLVILFRKPLIGQLIRWRMDPGKPFSAFTPPPAPDYSKPASWAALPDQKDYADYKPPGVSDPKGPKAADVFFIHPTTFMSNKGWNASIEDKKPKERVDTAVMKHQASPFNACCRVFGPRYRQATLFFAVRFDYAGKEALNLAYADVVRAFKYYMKHWNKGRPLILAGHSQGAMHAIRLLEEHIATSPIKDQLIAAYIVGNPVFQDKFSRGLKPFHPCRDAKDTGCVASWMTLGKKADVKKYGKLKQYYHPGGFEKVKGKTHICTHPITWKLGGGLSTYKEHLGAVRFKRGDAPMYPIQPNTVRGRCKHGAMIIDPIKIKKGFGNRMLGKDDFHIYDFNLFYMNIRKNAVTRVKAFLAKTKPAPKDAKAPKTPSTPNTPKAPATR